MPNARIHPVANDRLAELKRRLYKEKGLSVSRDDIASAAVHGVTLDQIWGMLPAFKMDAAAREAAQGQTADDDE